MYSLITNAQFNEKGFYLEHTADVAFKMLEEGEKVKIFYDSPYNAECFKCHKHCNAASEPEELVNLIETIEEEKRERLRWNKPAKP